MRNCFNKKLFILCIISIIVFLVLSLSLVYAENTITVTSVIYGCPGQYNNCDESVCCLGTLDITNYFKQQCDGKTECSVQLSNSIAGDPSSGCPKGATVLYICGAGGEQKVEPPICPQAGEGQTVSLDCGTSICTNEQTQTCTATNGCSGTQTCTNNAWGTCATSLIKCSDGVCRTSCVASAVCASGGFSFNGYCWYKAALGQGCLDRCNEISQGSCVAGAMDSSNCDVCKHFKQGVGVCRDEANGAGWHPGYSGSTSSCEYDSTGGNDCGSYSPGDYERMCACGSAQTKKFKETPCDKNNPVNFQGKCSDFNNDLSKCNGDMNYLEKIDSSMAMLCVQDDAVISSKIDKQKCISEGKQLAILYCSCKVVDSKCMPYIDANTCYYKKLAISAYGGVGPYASTNALAYYPGQISGWDAFRYGIPAAIEADAAVLAAASGNGPLAFQIAGSLYGSLMMAEGAQRMGYMMRTETMESMQSGWKILEFLGYMGETVGGASIAKETQVIVTKTQRALSSKPCGLPTEGPTIPKPPNYVYDPSNPYPYAGDTLPLEYGATVENPTGTASIPKEKVPSTFAQLKKRKNVIDLLKKQEKLDYYKGKYKYNLPEEKLKTLKELGYDPELIKTITLVDEYKELELQLNIYERWRERAMAAGEFGEALNADRYIDAIYNKMQKVAQKLGYGPNGESPFNIIED